MALALPFLSTASLQALIAALYWQLFPTA